MSNSTSKPRRAMQLGTVLIAVAGLVATLTVHASAQTTNTPDDRVEITDEFCINRSLGGPITYAHDNTGDGVADLCSLPRTRRATSARQHALERMASELALLFGHLFAQECLGVSETFGEPLAERTDECAAPRQADFLGTSIPPVPAAPLPEANLDSRFYSGPTVTSPSFCINHSFGGPITYPHDNNGDGIADLCSLPRTRRAAVARQNALERMAVDLKPRFDVLFAEECLRVPATLGEPLAEAEDECAVYRAGGTPLPTPGGTPETGTPGQDGATQQPYIPAPQRPSDTPAPTYHDRAAQNVILVPGDQEIVVSWAEPEEDRGTVFKYIVQWRTSGQSWTTSQQHDADTSPHTISGLTNFTTYQIRILAQRGTNDRYTPTLTATPGWSAPPTWPDRKALTNPVYGQVVVDWNIPDRDRLGIHHYIIQWDTNARFADNNNPFPRDCARDTTCNEDQTTGTETTDTTYEINGLTNGTYYVRVQGVTGNGPGVWSLTQSITLRSTRLDPGQPTGLTLVTAGASANQLTVSWTAPAATGADPAPTDYFVQWRNVTQREAFSATDRQERIAGVYTIEGQETTITTAPLTTTTIDPVSPRNEYEVRVQAVNVDTPGRWSQAVKHVVGEAQPPTVISIDPGDGDLEVLWNKPAGLPQVTSYFLQWGFSCSNSAFSTARQATVQSTSNEVRETISNLDNNRRYYIRIQSINSFGSGDWSSCIIGEPGTLNAPTNVSLADSDTNPRALTVTWSYARAGDDLDKPHLSGFKIRYRRDGSTSWSTTRSLRLTVELKDQSGRYIYDLTSLTPGYEYEVQVLAQNAYGDGAWTESSTDIPGEQFIPDNVSVSENDDDTTGNIRSLIVSWEAPSVGQANITGFRVQYRRSGSTSWSTSSSSLANDATSHTITGLSTGVRHEVRVVARTASNGDGPGSDLDSDQQPIPSAIPGSSFVPTAVTMQQSTDRNSVHQLQIGWTHSHTYPSTGITYSVQYRTCASAAANCGSWTTRSASTTTYDIPVTSLQDDTYYQARVRANSSAIGGSSLYSEESSRWLVVINDDEITVTELQ